MPPDYQRGAAVTHSERVTQWIYGTPAVLRHLTVTIKFYDIRSTDQGTEVMAEIRDMGDAALLAEFEQWDCKVQTATGWGAALMQSAKWRDACGRILTERGLMQDFAPCIRRDPHSPQTKEGGR